MEFLVKFNKVENVKKFVCSASMYDCDILVKSKNRNFIVDGCSIMGIFSLDLSNPVIVDIRNIEIAESFKNDVAEFVID